MTPTRRRPCRSRPCCPSHHSTPVDDEPAAELLAAAVPVIFCPTVTLTVDTIPSIGASRVAELRAVCAVSTAACAVVIEVWSTVICCWAVATLASAAVVSSPASAAVVWASCAVDRAV